ncbi:hypothetical protein M9Y10_044529 [Tritrichomonas musculus]|uniref:SWIM-type domain-containing protein n=1 Tax=Tritrichomonas musculus TaxID=1915356 RepID=A0ABR2JSZ5_9EUKA
MFYNFKKKINSLGLTSHQKDCLNDLFETICYTPHYDTAMSCLGKLFDVVELKSYLSKEVVPYLHMFARSCINESFCLGYNVTSPAESMNNMLKRSLPARTLTLSESRKEFDSILYNHYQCISEKQHKKRIPSDNIFYEHYSPNIANEIMHQIEKSKTVILEDDHFDNYTHVAYQQEFQNQKCRLNEWCCECKLNYFSGVPCSHIISLHSKLFNEYPFFLIDPRWKISNNNITISNDDVLNLSNNLVEESNDISIPLPIKLKQETYDPYSLSTLTQEQRFLRIFHIAKQLCSAAACDIYNSCMVMEKFKKLLDHVQILNKEVNKQNNDETFQSNDTNVDDKNNSSKHNDNSLELIVPKTNTVVDHCDIIGKRKGRPKKPRKAKEHSQNTQCIICLGKHHMKDCFFYNELEKLLKEQPLDDPGKRKCGLCRHFDHIIKTCPLRLKAVEYYKNET